MKQNGKNSTNVLNVSEFYIKFKIVLKSIMMVKFSEMFHSFDYNSKTEQNVKTIFE